jgi:hypothetical protein
MTIASMKSLQLGWLIVVLACCNACSPGNTSVGGPKPAVMAETALGAIPMPAVGVLHRTGDSPSMLLTEPDTVWGDLPQVSRVFGMLVTAPENAARQMRVWVWKHGNPAERIDVTGEITPMTAPDHYQIRFRDVSADETFRSWASGDTRSPPLKLILHRHDSGFAIDVASDQGAASHLVIVCGAPESPVYAARFGQP